MSPSTEEVTSRRSGRLPIGVYLLSFSLFAMGSAEFLLAGVLPAVAGDLDVSLAAAGALITTFAIGVVLGGPPFAVLSLHWPRRTAIAITQVVFAVAVAIGLVGDFWVLLVSRFLAGVAYAGFFAVASVTAVGLAGPGRAARASGVVVSGLSLAMVFGGPIGTLVGHYTGWRGGFWGVVALTAAGAVGCVAGLSRPAPVPAAQAGPSVAAELRSLRNPALWGLYAITILTTASYMISYNYLAATLADVTAIPEVWIAPVLAVFGIGAFAGLSIGGRISDRHPHRALLTGAIGIAVLSALLIALAEHAAGVVPVVFLLGVFAFVLNPAIYGRVFAVAATAPTLAGATTVSAFQLGISLTPALAAVVLTQVASPAAVSWFGVLLALAAIPVVLADRRRPASGQTAAESHSPRSR